MIYIIIASHEETNGAQEWICGAFTDFNRAANLIKDEIREYKATLAGMRDFERQTNEVAPIETINDLSSLISEYEKKNKEHPQTLISALKSIIAAREKFIAENLGERCWPKNIRYRVVEMPIDTWGEWDKI